MRGEGKPQFSMLISILSLILNFGIDYLAIKIFGLGIKGVAISSLLSVFICLIVSISFFFTKSEVYHFGKFVFDRFDVKQIILNGSSELIGEFSMCITMLAYNAVILKIAGVSGVAAFAVVGYTSYLIQMIMLGIGQGMSPLVSFVFGAKDNYSAKRLRKAATVASTSAGVIAFLTFVVIRNLYSHLFIKDVAIENMISVGILIFSISFVLEGFNTIASFYYTSIGYVKESAVISLARGLVILMISLLILPSVLGMTGVWLVAPVTEVITLFICIFYYKTR